MIFHRIVGSALEILGNDIPALFLLLAHDIEKPFLLVGPLVLLNLWIDVHEPALAASLAGSAIENLFEIEPHHGVVINLSFIYIF